MLLVGFGILMYDVLMIYDLLLDIKCDVYDVIVYFSVDGFDVIFVNIDLLVVEVYLVNEVVCEMILVCVLC